MYFLLVSDEIIYYAHDLWGKCSKGLTCFLWYPFIKLLVKIQTCTFNKILPTFYPVGIQPSKNNISSKGWYYFSLYHTVYCLKETCNRIWLIKSLTHSWSSYINEEKEILRKVTHIQEKQTKKQLHDKQEN